MLACVAALAAVGLAAGVSAAPPGEAWTALGLRSLHLALGLAAFLAGLALPVAFMRRLAPFLLGGVFLLLVALFLGMGQESHAAVRWMRIGPVRFQPSVFLQCLWPVVLASWCARDPLRLVQPRELQRIFVLFAVLALPVLFQPDLGSVLILFGVTGMTLLFAGAPTRLLRVLLPLGIAVVALAALLFNHVGARLSWWRQPSYQVQRADEALAVGGLFGRGAGQGVLKEGHVPEGETDFILALIGEEWGLAGTATLWSLFVAFTLFGVRLARHARRRYGAILAASAVLMISVQAALNLAVVTGAVPPKGLPLPFISRGGSSILALSALLGLAVHAALEDRRSFQPALRRIPWLGSNAPA